MLLEGKVAIVTGADSGIGKAIAVALAREGAAVCVNFHSNAAAAEQVRQAIEAEGSKAITVQADVSRVPEVDKLVSSAVAAFGRLDIMVNNAGFETRTSVLDTTEAQFDAVIGVDLKGPFFGTQVAARQMLKQGTPGRIINISSVHEDWPMPGNTAYCCAKGGVRMLTRTAGVELAPRGITVVGVGPGAVATPINKATLADPEQKALLRREIPEHQIAKPEEIAGLVVWLASAQSQYVTATTYFIDGGLMQSGAGL